MDFGKSRPKELVKSQPISPCQSIEGFKLKVVSPARFDVLINLQRETGNLGKFGLGES
jgi:hypothetical protein